MVDKAGGEDDAIGIAIADPGKLQRVLSTGVRTASVIDLLCVAVSRRADDVPASELPARRMLQRYQSIKGLGEAGIADLKAATGLDEFELLRLMAAMEIGRRIANTETGPRDTIDSSHDVFARMDWLRDEKREHFLALMLDAKANVMREATIHIGTLTASMVGPREVFREAVRDGAASVIVIHNHPSGDPSPSPEDVQVTKDLVKVGQILDIPVLDHIIIGHRRYFSFADQGMMA